MKTQATTAKSLNFSYLPAVNATNDHGDVSATSWTALTLSQPARQAAAVEDVRSTRTVVAHDSFLSFRNG